MRPIRVKSDNPLAIQQAVDAIKAGELVIFPTDTLYGVGVDVLSAAAIKKLYLAKGRDLHKGIPVLLSGEDKLHLVVEEVSKSAREYMAAYWPGPLTLILAKKSGLPENLSPSLSIAVRVPDNEVARRFIAAAGGALAVTSANLAGQPPARTADEASVVLGDSVALILDGGPVRHGLASTILDCTTFPPKIIRQGPLSARALGLSTPGVSMETDQ